MTLRLIPALVLLLTIATLVAACGSTDPAPMPIVPAQIATPTPEPTPTSAPTPTGTAVPPTATPTPEPPTRPQGTPVPESAGNIVLTLSASKDNTIYDDSNHLGRMSNGAGAYLFAGNTRNSDARRGLIAFDIARALPAGADVQSARLTLYISQTTAGNESVALHRVSANWQEGTTNASANEGGGGAVQGDDATWIYAFNDVTSWQTRGGDFESTASASAVAGARDTTVFWESDGMVADVQAWLEGPDTNFGWLLKADENKQRTSKRFSSRENSEELQRPVLTVAYRPASS